MSVFGKDTPDSLYVLLCRYIRSRTKVTVFKAIILTIEPQPAGPTFARSALTANSIYGLKYTSKRSVGLADSTARGIVAS